MHALLKILIIFSLWDGFTTFYGVLSVFTGEFHLSFFEMVQYDLIYTLTSLAFAGIILAILLSARAVLQSGWHVGFRVLVGIAFAYDLFTSYIGNRTFIARTETVTVEQFFLLIGGTMFICGATMALPYLKPTTVTP